MKKFLALTLVLALALALAACGGTTSSTAAPAGSEPAASSEAVSTDTTSTGGGAGEPIAKEDLLVGIVHIMDVGDQGYTYNHDQGVHYMCDQLGIDYDTQTIPKFNIDDQDVAATNAAITELVDAGCQIIFATSFSYGSQVVEMAKLYPDVQFCHATGSDAHYQDLPNLHNYFAKIHEARYLGGVAAGMKLKELGESHLGYVAAYPFAEVISGFTAFFLRAKSIVPDVTMDVIYIESWGDAEKERQVAEALITTHGAKVISQHSDNVSPALAAQDLGAFHVGYNNDMAPAAPQASLISARINWGIYMTVAAQAMIDGTEIPMDWAEGIETGAAYLSDLNTAIAAEGTQEAIDAATADIEGGMYVFSGPLKDTEGTPAEITSFEGDVMYTFEDDSSFWDESNPVDNTSAPSFNPIIEGINIIT